VALVVATPVAAKFPWTAASAGASEGGAGAEDEDEDEDDGEGKGEGEGEDDGEGKGEGEGEGKEEGKGKGKEHGRGGVGVGEVETAASADVGVSVDVNVDVDPGIGASEKKYLASFSSPPFSPPSVHFGDGTRISGLSYCPSRLLMPTNVIIDFVSDDNRIDGTTPCFSSEWVIGLA
jgi:hypothetical protein